jgi:hypothetical protein
MNPYDPTSARASAASRPETSAARLDVQTPERQATSTPWAPVAARSGPDSPATGSHVPAMLQIPTRHAQTAPKRRPWAWLRALLRWVI